MTQDNYSEADQNTSVGGASNDQTRLNGLIKWFDPVKGFGFVVSDDGGPDILLHINVLRNFGQSSVADGARVELLAQETARGVQAVEVLSIEPPETSPITALDDMASLDNS